MAKLSEKLEVSGFLYRIGFAINDITSLLGFKSNKQLIAFLRKENITPIAKEKQPLSNLKEDEMALLKEIGLLDKLKEVYPELLEDEKEVSESIPFFDSKQLFTSAIKKDEKVKVTYDSEVKRYKSLVNVQDVNNVCSVCENKGFIYLPNKNGTFGVKSHKCPKCKGESVHNKRHEVVMELDKEVLEKYIPNMRYREVHFNITELNKGIPLPPQLKTKIAYTSYEKLLEDLLLDFRNGKLPKSSILLTAPDGFGKKFFVYQAMKECLSYGFKPSPILDILELHSLYFSYQYEDLMKLLDNDILFVDVPSGSNRLSPSVFSFILNYCERKGIPSIFISRTDKAGLIQKKNGYSNVDWFDIFCENSFDYDFGHLKNVGIVGMASVEIMQYKKTLLDEFSQLSPIMMKSNSYTLPEEPVEEDNLLLTKGRGRKKHYGNKTKNYGNAPSSAIDKANFDIDL